jgi:hypothetical protein
MDTDRRKPEPRRGTVSHHTQIALVTGLFPLILIPALMIFQVGSAAVLFTAAAIAILGNLTGIYLASPRPGATAGGAATAALVLNVVTLLTLSPLPVFPALILGWG